VTDRVVTPLRVVSLVPSVTETLSAWGVEPIACTRFCERPDLPHVGGTKNPDIGTIVGLEPDVVVVDRQENRREDAEELAAAGLRVLVLDVRSVGGLSAELAPLAAAVGVELGATMLPAYPPLELRAFVPIWRRPWMTIGAGTYGSSVLAALGIVNVFAGAPSDYPELELADVGPLRPDVVLVPSEPYEFTDAHLDELDELAPTVRVDGRDLFWWGARTPDALARLYTSIGGAMRDDRP
jgi:ABC-type Fe3+-hydroxamate transport system substrate-binding protein